MHFNNNPPIVDGTLRTMLKRKMDEMNLDSERLLVAEKHLPKRLHPLHSVEFITAQVVHTGCYPDPNRCTGRTTILALEYITQALKQPYKVITVRDHYPTVMSHQRLAQIINDLARRMGLDHLFVNVQRNVICFGERP